MSDFSKGDLKNTTSELDYVDHEELIGLVRKTIFGIFKKNSDGNPLKKGIINKPKLKTDYSKEQE